MLYISIMPIIKSYVDFSFSVSICIPKLNKLYQQNAAHTYIVYYHKLLKLCIFCLYVTLLQSRNNENVGYKNLVLFSIHDISEMDKISDYYILHSKIIEKILTQMFKRT